ncbi:MAG: T9SS type A sorting domain-containing protein [Chitinophagales bacterium]
MNLHLHRLSAALLLTLTCSGVFSQIVSGNAFLKSNYVEMGINQYGVYISNVAPPVTYQSIGALPGRSIIADEGKDGWATGTPGYCGDYFAPGTPEEGFAIQANGNYYYNTYYGAPADASGAVMSYNNTVAAVKATWKGTISAIGLQVTQVTSITHGGSQILTTVQLKNTSATVINGVYYTRSADPDNEQQATGDFTTDNIIVQNHPVDPWAWVSASGLTYCYFAMASMQSNAMASYGTFFTTDVLPQQAWAGIAPWSTVGSIVADQAIQMNFKIGKINPGQTKVLNFIYGTNEADLADFIGFTGDDIVDKMEAQLNGTESEFSPEFKISPNPTSGDINLYGYGFSSTSVVELQIVNMMGQIVTAQQLENSNGITSASFQLDGSLVNGTYLANFVVDGKTYAQPFILNR